MAGRTPAAAVTDYLRHVQRAVSCIATAVVTVSPGGYRTADPSHWLTLAGNPVRLGGQSRLILSLRQWYRLVTQIDEREPWNVITAGYEYAFLDADEREIVAYHWHPHVPDVPFTHLHISHGVLSLDESARFGIPAGASLLRPDVAKAHIPTGYVGLETVLWLAITQFRVQPFRRDWARVLRRPEV